LKKEISEVKKKILKEVSQCTNISYLNYRIDYITAALMCQGNKKYSNLNMTREELVFYLEELRKRVKRLKRFQELDEEKYRKRGLI